MSDSPQKRGIFGSKGKNIYGYRKRQLPITNFLRNTFAYNRNNHNQFPSTSSSASSSTDARPSSSSTASLGIPVRRFSNDHFIDPYFYEKNRLASFRSWAIPSISKDELAMFGFIFTEIGDVVKCVFCHVLIGKLKT